MFLAHINDIPLGLKKPLPQYDKRKTLVNNGEFKLANNICPHQGSLILSQTGKEFVCQFHHWSWNSDGQPIGQGNTKICNNTKLNFTNTYQENSLLLDTEYDLSCIQDLDLSHMVLVEERIDRVNCDFKNIMDVFLDVDHIPLVHRGVYDKLGISGPVEVDWIYHKWGNIQLVRRTNALSEEFKKTLLGNETLGAAWIAIYPGTMIEWQAGALFVTVCIPRDSVTDVCVFKYKDSRYSDLNWQINDNIIETAWAQDKHQAESIVKFSNNKSNLEDSKLHFREWLDEIRI
jgi:phenylpropionate dioxygenase-like ring-hydroxylating dioxygenase large terminal subunit